MLPPPEKSNTTPLRVQPKARPENILDWSIEDVCSFIDALNFDDGEISNLFRQNRVDGETLFGITVEELKEIGINALGIRKKIILEVQKLTSKLAFNISVRILNFVLRASRPFNSTKDCRTKKRTRRSEGKTTR